MPVHQVEESELLNLRAVAQMVNTVLGNKEARPLLLKARKITNPEAVIPELDAAAPVNAEIENLRAEMAKEREARETMLAEQRERERLAEFTRSWEAQKDALRSRGWRDEGIAGIEALAKERAIPDLEVAEALWEKLHPPSSPATSSGSGSWGFFDAQPEDDTFVKKMVESGGDDEAALDAEIRKVLSETRAQSGARR